MNVSVGSSSMWKERSRMWTAIAGVGALLAAFALYLALTGSTTESAAAEVPAPAVVDHPNGSELARIRVSQSGIKRLDLRTAQVRSERIDGKARMVVPYSSVIYDSEGETWVYVSSKPRSFMRQQITVDEIVGARVILSAGPKAGTTIATVGAQELWGAELGIDSGSH